MKKARVVGKGIINYIFAMIFAVIFALFLNANVGWFMLLALILAPVLSVFFAWIASRMVLVSCTMEDALLSKGDKYTMDIRVKNPSLFPTPPVEVILTDEPGVRSEHRHILVSVLSRASRDFEAVFQAKICGLSRVGIEKVLVTDYLGLFSFPIKRADQAALKSNVAVIPDIAELSPKDENIRKVMQVSLSTDDSEDTVESAINTFGGFPGYDSREYVPGDPLKRINWKQSAKRSKLLVRLDDEMAAQSVSVVLDSTFLKEEVDVYGFTSLPRYKDCAGDEILPKIAEEAVENALGIIQVLVRHDYTVNFYARVDGKFSRYEIEDESGLESVRLMLAHYSFAYKQGAERYPREELLIKGSGAFLFSTPNSYENAGRALSDVTEALHATIYSAIEEGAKKDSVSGNGLSFLDLKPNREQAPGRKERILEAVKALVIPYLLALLLSMSFFGVFDIPAVSFWTLCQALVCGGVFVLCEYVKKHRVIGTMLVTVLVMSLLSLSAKIVFAREYGLDYMHWFLSGGESVDTTVPYLLTLLMVFTVFFAMVIYYFIRIQYRTSFLMLVSLIPLIVSVKVMQDIDMVSVVFVTVLNVAAFLLHTRMQRDKGKRMVGYVSGLVSVGLYALIFVMTGLAAPREEETRYYYVFENLFMGGNVSEMLPEEYSVMSRFSGNADGFNELNNRKLYVISGQGMSSPMYFKRQNFDLYDFEHDRWYELEEYAQPLYSVEAWTGNREFVNLGRLSAALKCGEVHQPGFLEKYGMQDAVAAYEEQKKVVYVETMNFPSQAFIVPSGALRVWVSSDSNGDLENTYVTENGVFQRKEGFLENNVKYTAEFYEEAAARQAWIEKGGSDFDTESSLEMLESLREILVQNKETEHIKTVEAFLKELRTARDYSRLCRENREEIPESVRTLAQEITKDCTYDWEKAKALQEYFEQNDFVYDLSYKAPDDSVEYFLFQGKTGTCSDFASAYALLARSQGLIVRYAEGFVPQEEYDGQYVVRTDCGHAYPEVYIQNVGFVVYEATRPAVYVHGRSRGSGAMTYFMTVGYRLLLIFALVCGGIVLLLFLHNIVSPFCRELYFGRKLRRAQPSRAVVMLYKQIRDRYAVNEISNARVCTPYEYAVCFEQVMDYDISEMVYLLERGTYSREDLQESDKKRAEEIYKGAVAKVKAAKKARRNVKGEGRKKQKENGR